MLASRRPQPMLSTKAIGEQHRVCGLAAGHSDPRTPIPCWPLLAPAGRDCPETQLGRVQGGQSSSIIAEPLEVTE